MVIEKNKNNNSSKKIKKIIIIGYILIFVVLFFVALKDFSSYYKTKNDILISCQQNKNYVASVLIDGSINEISCYPEYEYRDYKIELHIYAKLFFIFLFLNILLLCIRSVVICFVVKDKKQIKSVIKSTIFFLVISFFVFYYVLSTIYIAIDGGCPESPTGPVECQGFFDSFNTSFSFYTPKEGEEAVKKIQLFEGDNNNLIKLSNNFVVSRYLRESTILRSILRPEDDGINVILINKVDPSILFNSVFVKNDGETKFTNVNNFLENSNYYYNQITSVPWLNEFRKKNPDIKIEIFTVDGVSFYEQAKEEFIKKMQNCGVASLVNKIQENTKQITYVGIKISDNIIFGQYYDTWIILPDKRMVPIDWSPYSSGAIATEVNNNNSNELCACNGSGIILSPDGIIDSSISKTSVPISNENGYKPTWECSKF